MRRSTRAAILLACGSALAACSLSQPRIVAPAGSKSVRVKVKCNGDKLDVSVKPFAVTIRPNETVYWVPDLGDAGKNDVTVTIVPKNPAQWPFLNPPPTIPKDDGISSGPLRSTTPDTVSYNLLFECTFDGLTRSIMIDPDIIIGT